MVSRVAATPETMMIMRLFVVLAALLSDTVGQHQRTATPVVKDGKSNSKI